MENIDLNALFGVDTVEKVRKRLNEDAAFLAEAQADLNAAVKAHYGLELPVPLGVCEGPDGWTACFLPGDALADSELDLVAGGYPARPSMKDLGKNNKISFG
ncbi:hypothetical protein ADZ37_10490 [Pannonibacter phragmitetus]|uniref:hypothetical protein n=1 Tax=Pannonibacter TaxID=227873 RepID=UPI00067D2EF2|nr:MULTISPECIES: hypothetical protein [Pannonibacter]KND19405.1 hypothetical protein ADZ37_10490 [Pannonibacter phragmitetus]MBA4207168.1 hypothetical protein [Polymorphum sp.]